MTEDANHQGQTKLVRTAIVGTGYIAEFHARAVKALKGVDLVAVCDPNERSVDSFARNWGVSQTYNSLESMLRTQTIDCLHLLAPPDRHFSLAKLALNADVHVFLEKPMCTSSAEASELVELAKNRKLYLGVSHNFLFSSAYVHLRDVVKSGALGRIDHLAFNHFFELAQIRLGPFDSWMLREPGNVILETGPHLVSAMIDLVGMPNSLSVIADRAVTLPNGAAVYRRWRIRAAADPIAVDMNINFGPGFPQRTILVRGLSGSAVVDLDANTCIVDQRTPLDVDLDRFRRSRRSAKHVRSQAHKTLADYVLGKFKIVNRGNPYQNSISDSVAAFYSAVRDRRPLDTRIDDSLGRDVIEYCTKIINAAHLPMGVSSNAAPLVPVAKAPTILVLGGAGFIGRELIEQLLTAGHSVRAMVRGSSAALNGLRGDRLDVVRGDIANAADLNRALSGIEFVYDLAHAQAKTWDEYKRNVIEPTRLVGELCLAADVKRLIYTGTIDSYYAGGKASFITEDTRLDKNICRRNYYARAKAEAEGILVEMHKTAGLPLVILRPGIVIGAGGNPFHWGVGRFSDNICEVWGEGNNKLPFVLVADVASALVRAIEVPGIEGKSYNLIDTPLLTARDYLKDLEQRSGQKLTVIYRPIWKFYASDLVKWVAKVFVRHPDRHRIPSYDDWESRTQKAEFKSDRARSELGWSPASDRGRLVNEGIGDALKPWLEAIK